MIVDEKNRTIPMREFLEAATGARVVEARPWVFVLERGLGGIIADVRARGESGNPMARAAVRKATSTSGAEGWKAICHTWSVVYEPSIS